MAYPSTRGYAELSTCAVWALVTGFPSEKRRKRWLGMFQAFMDESVGDQTRGERLFVMCGFIATAENWAAFSGEWQRHLDMQSPAYRKLDSFHLNEMTSERDRERIQWFYRVIEEKAHAAISFVLDMQALDSVFAEFPWPRGYKNLEDLKAPYSIAFHQILCGLPQAAGRAGINRPIDFFFDETSNKMKCLEGWEIMRRSPPPAILPLLGETPAFRNDKTVLPLQAADLLAGLTRRWGEQIFAAEKSDGPLPGNVVPWEIRRSYPVISNYYGAAQIRVRFKRQFQRLNEWTASRASSPPSSPGRSS